VSKKKNIIIILLILLLIFLVSTIIFLLKSEKNSESFLPTDKKASEWSGKQQLDSPYTNTGKIAVPGFDSLVFVTDRKEQKVNFYNPSENQCLFLMTLYVDNKEYWKSGYVKPGDGYYNITLNNPLSIGIYDAYLNIQCFKEDGKALNSANVDFKLTVQEE